MENTIPSKELTAVGKMNEQKADRISKTICLITSPASPAKVSRPMVSIGKYPKRSMSITVEIDRGSAIEKLTWEITAKKAQ